MADVTPDPIMKVALGFMAAKHLFAASEIGVFEQLAGSPATLDELAERTGIPRRTLRIVARRRTSTCSNARAGMSRKRRGCCSSISGPTPRIPSRRLSRSWPASSCSGAARATSTAPEEARGWLGETGWRALEHAPLAGPASLIVAETMKS